MRGKKMKESKIKQEVDLGGTGKKRVEISCGVKKKLTI